MNAWLQKTARQHQDKGLSRTYVATAEDDPKRIVGYYAVSATLVETEGMPGKHPKEVSAVLLGRLAVDKNNKGQGLGGCLLMHALEQAAKAADIIGLQCVIVDALDADAAEFYRYYGFAPLTTDPMRLVLPMSTVRQL
ncbi:GNAT family N-acetyltransferase [Cupriavidus respiraculi]|uniref:N-acetyltransferase domain-containing protein n=2 Tax=Cupriavidus respiraculi TaxID=195930 RepID=A0ABN7ZEE2_9BURK|nr:GNAT family N-acetyltransferase [Cupriavidus respiraculi]CAG9183708.1 hypothetical protein LMG21510_04914 [Cupriavidus respiraculi]